MRIPWVLWNECHAITWEDPITYLDFQEWENSGNVHNFLFTRSHILGTVFGYRLDTVAPLYGTRRNQILSGPGGAGGGGSLPLWALQPFRRRSLRVPQSSLRGCRKLRRGHTDGFAVEWRFVEGITTIPILIVSLPLSIVWPGTYRLEVVLDETSTNQLLRCKATAEIGRGESDTSKFCGMISHALKCIHM